MKPWWFLSETALALLQPRALSCGTGAVRRARRRTQESHLLPCLPSLPSLPSLPRAPQWAGHCWGAPVAHASPPGWLVVCVRREVFRWNIRWQKRVTCQSRSVFSYEFIFVYFYKLYLLGLPLKLKSVGLCEGEKYEKQLPCCVFSFKLSFSSFVFT